MRAFFAVDIPGDIKAKIRKFISDCRKIQEKDIKYVGDENLHITIKFLGDIDEASLNFLFAGLKEYGGLKPVLDIRAAGAFPNVLFPKVAWVGVAENAGLKSLFEKIEESALRSGVEPEEREFHPHITIARVKGRVKNEWTEFLKKSSGIDFGSFTPAGFAAYKSELTAGGPIYTIIKSFPFEEP